MAETSQPEQNPGSGPVSAVFAREVRPEYIEAFELWVNDVYEIVHQFDGYQGLDVIRPADHIHPEYVIILRFDEYQHLKAWMSSPERAAWIEKSEEMLVKGPFIQEAHGLEPWFTLPGQQAVAAPARYKMAVLTIIALYPLLLLAIRLFGSLLVGWHPFLITLITVIVLVSLMTYLIMPRLTKLFSFWLFPKPSRDG